VSHSTRQKLPSCNNLQLNSFVNPTSNSYTALVLAADALASGEVCVHVRRMDFPASVAQLDRAPDFGSGCWGFKSLRMHHLRS
jgi:hypothetical protein